MFVHPKFSSKLRPCHNTTFKQFASPFHKAVKSDKRTATAHAQNALANAQWRHCRQRSDCQN